MEQTTLSEFRLVKKRTFIWGFTKIFRDLLNFMESSIMMLEVLMPVRHLNIFDQNMNYFIDIHVKLIYLLWLQLTSIGWPLKNWDSLCSKLTQKLGECGLKAIMLLAMMQN